MWLRFAATVLVVAVAGTTGCAAPAAPPPPVGDAASAGRLDAAVATYQRYLVAQAEELGPQAEEFAAAVRSGRAQQAKVLFPVVRAPWERIEPVAGSFEDLDSRMDGRDQDARPPGVAFTGYHRLEKDLWLDGLRDDSPAIADQLVADAAELRGRVASFRPTPEQMVYGAGELLDEVALVKLSGEEDGFASTDLWDIDANVDGCAAVVDALRPVIDQRDPALGAVLDQRFADVRRVLAGQRVGGGFRPFDELTAYDVKKLTVAVDELSAAVKKTAGVVGP